MHLQGEWLGGGGADKTRAVPVFLILGCYAKII